MKVLLVATNRERFPYPVAPLGVLYVASAARAAGHDVDLLDMGLEANPQRALRRTLAAKEYGVVAFGIRNLDNCWAFAPRLYFDEVRLLAETVRRHYSGSFILGGTGFSVSPQGWMQRLKPEGGVVGEGERPFVEVLARLAAGKSLDGIDGVMVPSKNGSQTVQLGSRTLERPGDLQLPAHELCGYPKYVKRGGFVGVQTKRGCPLKCTYCIYPQLEGKRYRLRPPEAVVEEVETVLTKRKVNHFFFVDSVFNDPRKHALEICRALARRRLPVKWMAFCNPLGFDEDLAMAMAEAGCIGVEFGLDAATPKMLSALCKPFGQAEIRTALGAAHKAGMPFLLSMLYGGPGETWADVAESQDFLNSCAPATCVFASYGIRIYEGTSIAAQAVREGVVAATQDLFDPVYYLSPGLAERTVENLDRIARRRPEWSSPADWRKPIMRWAQRVMVLFDVRPPWKHVRGYGQHMRRQIK
jgi:radical SAM superfamily enzyme YgiQ (UPF0313 family)